MSKTVAELLAKDLKQTKGLPEGTIIRFDRPMGPKFPVSHPNVSSLREFLMDIGTPNSAGLVGREVTVQLATDKPTYVAASMITYVAIFVGGHWYLTGMGSVASRRYTHRDFLELLLELNASNIAVATAWDEVEL